jgi:AAA domain-containing protein
MLFRCVAAIPNAGGSCVEHFYPDTEEGRASADEFANQYNRGGWGVYDCVSPLRGRQRSKDNVARINALHIDLDARHMTQTKEKIVDKIRSELMPFGIVSVLNDSGRGVHMYTIFNEPIDVGTPEAEKAERLLKRMVAQLGADRAPAHFAALMRRPGTMNSKEGGGLCHTILDTGARCELSDVEAYLDLVDGTQELFATRANDDQPANGNGAPRIAPHDKPIDVESRLAAMQFGDTDGLGVNATCCAVIAALIWKAWHPADIHELVLNAIMQMAERCGLKWDRAAEDRQTNERILAAYHNLFEKEYDPSTGEIPIWLPGEFHEQWAAALAEGKKPVVTRNGSAWHVRGFRLNGNGSTHETADAKEETSQSATKAPFVLRPFVPFDPAKLPPRQFLFGKHYQRRTTGGTVAPGGSGKSSLEMVEGVSMATARNLLGEQPSERVRVWYHNGEDSMDELNRRLAAICQYYQIPLEELSGWFFMTSGNEVPLRVANGYKELKIDEPLIAHISEEIARNEIDVVVLDPLVTLHSVSEQDNVRMDRVVRIFAAIADAQTCAIELAHHTRKLSAGNTDYGGDDIRGASSIKDAVRSARMLNQMTEKDAETVGIPEHDRVRYFRTDKVKSNNAPPAKAVWRRFVSVELPNGDDVGVVVAWDYPGQGAPSAEMAAAERAADSLFMQLLVRLTSEGRTVSDRAGTKFAPHVFSQEAEAKTAKIGKRPLAEAMRRLFAAKRIRVDDKGEGGHKTHFIVMT